MNVQEVMFFFEKGLFSSSKKTNFFVVKGVEADYIKPATFGDVLEVNTKLVSKKMYHLMFTMKFLEQTS